MPPRDPELPEGTDAIVSGAAADDTSGSGTGFVARGGGTDRLVSQVRDQVGNLRGQATERLRGYADDGKSKATDLLEEMAGVIDDAARSIDQRLGEEYGEYAHRASGAVADFAGRIRGKSVDDLVDDTRDFVRKSPTVTIAAAAVVGFALMRVVRTGLEEAGGRRRTGGRSGGNGSGKSGRRNARNADTTTGGGA
jgi:ElaB/YqjD/DUF883 family membrane-anchored ribosome-binding protein